MGQIVGQLVRLVCLVVAWALLRVEVDGRERLPIQGSLVAAMPHRNWVEPFILLGLLPRPPVWIAEGQTVSTSRWRKWLASLAGGVIAVRSGRVGPRAFERTADAATAAVRAGRVVAIFPEDGPPSTPPQLRPLSNGLAHLAARSRAPVVPIAFGGSHELYLRRRIVIRVLPGLEPPADTSRGAIVEWMRRFEALARQSAAEVHETAESKPPRVKVGRWLTGRYPRAPN